MKRQAALLIASNADVVEDQAPAGICSSSSNPIVDIATESSSSRTVFLLQFVTAEDISDESEYEDILSNIREIFSPFGELESIDIKLLSAFEFESCIDNEPELTSENYENSERGHQIHQENGQEDQEEGERHEDGNTFNSKERCCTAFTRHRDLLSQGS